MCHHNLYLTDTLYLQVHLHSSLFFLFWLVGEPAGDDTPAAMLHSEVGDSSGICFPVVITQFHIWVPFSVGIGIKTDVASPVQSPHSPYHIPCRDTCLSATKLCVRWGKNL